MSSTCTCALTVRASAPPITANNASKCMTSLRRFSLLICASLSDSCESRSSDIHAWSGKTLLTGVKKTSVKLRFCEAF